MEVVRNGVFETNSSSTNSLTIGDMPSNFKIPTVLCNTGQYCGRDFNYDDIDGRFTVLFKIAEDQGELTNLIQQLYKIGVQEIHIETRWYNNCYGEIDTENQQELLDVIKNEKELKNWLFGLNSEVSGHDDNYDYY